MASTWNRNVADEGDYLDITVTGENPGPPPDREDTADDITTYEADRAGGGAKINYHAQGDVVLTGISMKEGEIPDELSVLVNPAGQLIRLTDTGPAGTHWSYFVEGTVDGTSKQTRDPKIHNL